MNTYDLNSESIRYFLPNLLTEVAGEVPFFEKIDSYLVSAKVWLENEYLGPDDFLSDAHNDYALKILVSKAVADALPSLDLVVTPTGIAVVNTETLAPASKERVERLISSLRERVCKCIPTLLDFCHTYEVWRQSERGQYFCASFINSPQDCEYLDISFEEARCQAIMLETALAEHYLGRQMMNTLRSDYNCRVVTQENTLITVIRSTLLKVISYKDYNRVFDQNALWHIAQPILNELNYHPKYKELWESEMGDKFNVQSFVNDIKGGFYF